jgi:hypothetical protein
VQKKKQKTLAPPDHRGAIAAAVPLLAQWASNAEAPDKIIHLLEHHYTQAGLSFSALKGADAALAQVLVPAAVTAGCAVHLAIVHIEESGWAEYTGGGYYNRRYRRSRWDDDDEGQDDEFEVGEVSDGQYYINESRTPTDRPVDFGAIPIEDGYAPPPKASGSPDKKQHGAR